MRLGRDVVSAMACLVAGVFGGQVLAQEVNCTAAYGSPTRQTLESSSTSYGSGDPSIDTAESGIEKRSDPYDCGRSITDQQACTEEFTWVLSTQTGCFWTVNYYFMDYVNGSVECETAGDICDEAWAEARSHLRNDGNGAWIYLGVYRHSTGHNEYGNYAQTLTTTSAVKTCVGNGTAFSGSCRAQVLLTQANSRAYAHAVAIYTDAPTFWHAETLCP